MDACNGILKLHFVSKVIEHYSGEAHITSPLNSDINYNHQNFTITKKIIKLVNVQVSSCPKPLMTGSCYIAKVLDHWSHFDPYWMHPGC